MSTQWLWLLLVPVALFVALTSAFTVDASEYVYLTQFGRKVEIYDGGEPSQAGLHWKLPWPVQAVQRLDRRLQTFELPAGEYLTKDPEGGTIDRTLTVDATVSWRIADSEGADRFVRTVGSVDGAQRLLAQRIASELGAAIGDCEMEDLISTQARRVSNKREVIHRRLKDSLEGLQSDNGIEVVEVHIRRTSHPAAVREAIFDRIRTERAKKAAEYSGEGERLAADIRSKADREVAQMKADAEAKALQLKGEAEAQADKIRNEAMLADPQFYAFLRKLEDYQKMLGDGKSTLLLSTHREIFDLLYAPPTPGKKKDGK
jgi:membrane protease subunit HflC